MIRVAYTYGTALSREFSARPSTTIIEVTRKKETAMFGSSPRSRLGRVREDPTLVRNQPALRTSSGTIWIIVGALFIAVCLIPLVGIVASGMPAAAVAIATIVLMSVLYAAMVAVRFSATPGPLRLQRMAACFLGVAAVALIGMIVCVMIEWSTFFPQLS